MSSSTVLLCRLRLQLPFRRPPVSPLRLSSVVTVRAFSTEETETESEIAVNGEKVLNKPPICTADELHYVSVKNSDWRLALWRYHPFPQAIPRKHSLLLLSGVGTNAIRYDLSPEERIGWQWWCCMSDGGEGVIELLVNLWWRLLELIGGCRGGGNSESEMETGVGGRGEECGWKWGGCTKEF